MRRRERNIIGDNLSGLWRRFLDSHCYSDPRGSDAYFGCSFHVRHLLAAQAGATDGLAFAEKARDSRLD